MLDALPPDARAAVAAAALVALPGVLVVRAPWRAMPLVSLAFWVTSWTWFLGASRLRFLHVVLMMLAALSVFRLVRPGPFPRRGWAPVLIAVAAIVLAAPQPRRTVPSGTDAPIDALAAELLAWHDGWPASFEPLSPRQPFAASGLAAVSADVILLSRAPAHRALLAVRVLADVALLLALWSLARIRVPPARAALVAAAALLPTAAVAEGSGVLAAAFAVEAAALWHDHRGHASAFTAGVCTAAGLATDSATALGALILALLLTRPEPGPTMDRTPAPSASGRLRTAVWTAAVLALPLLWRPPRLDVPDAAALAAVAFTGLLGLAARRSAGAWRVVSPVLGVLAVAGPFLGGRAADVVTRDEAAAMAWIRDHALPLDLVCAPDVPAARWIPALAARATPVPLRPGWPRPDGVCAVRISLSGLLPPDANEGETEAFRAGQAVVWTTSQKR